jgi:hypothetical protein
VVASSKLLDEHLQSRAWNDGSIGDVRVGDGTGGAGATVTGAVGTFDRWCWVVTHCGHTAVDTLDLSNQGSVLEPVSVVVVSCTRVVSGGTRHGDGVVDSVIERVDLVAAA